MKALSSTSETLIYACVPGHPQGATLGHAELSQSTKSNAKEASRTTSPLKIISVALIWIKHDFVNSPAFPQLVHTWRAVPALGTYYSS